MPFDYKTGMGQPGGAGSTSKGAKSIQSGADLLKNIRAGIKTGSIKTR